MSQPEEVRALFHVYKVTARDYGSPTTRERCVVTTYPLEGETDLKAPYFEHRSRA